MLLQSIVAELDRELDRLQALRSIVADLRRTSAVVRRLTEPAAESPAQPAAAASPKLGRRPRSDAGQRRGPRTRKPVPDERALAATVPSGPVVFYPGRKVALAAEPVTVMPEPVVIPEHTPEQLDAESRALAARWAAQA